MQLLAAASTACTTQSKAAAVSTIATYDPWADLAERLLR
jgi:hypothetical protein